MIFWEGEGTHHHAEEGESSTLQKEAGEGSRLFGWCGGAPIHSPCGGAVFASPSGFSFRSIEGGAAFRPFLLWGGAACLRTPPLGAVFLQTREQHLISFCDRHIFTIFETQINDCELCF